MPLHSISSSPVGEDSAHPHVPFLNLTDPSLAAQRFVVVEAVSEVMASSKLTLNSKWRRRSTIHGAWEYRKYSKFSWSWVEVVVTTSIKRREAPLPARPMTRHPPRDPKPAPHLAVTLKSKCRRRSTIHGSWEYRKSSKVSWGWV
jgi:hypothetical protein